MDAQSRETDVKFTIANETWKFLAQVCVENVFLSAEVVWVRSVVVGKIGDFAGIFQAKTNLNANKTKKNRKKPVETEEM
jgi:hypothetical protein